MNQYYNYIKENIIQKAIPILQTASFWYFFIPLVLTIVLYLHSKSLKSEKKHLYFLFKANQKLSPASASVPLVQLKKSRARRSR